MPSSYDAGKPEIVDWIRETIPVGSTILDVGPGEGTYSRLLSLYDYVLDCVEIYEPYVTEFNLRDKYRVVFVQDVRDFDLRGYDFVIFGDVLEHIEVEEAQRLISLADNCLVAIPFCFPQGPLQGNLNEIHIQDDLTPAIMEERYPTLQVIWSNEHYAYYYKWGAVGDTQEEPDGYTIQTR